VGSQASVTGEMGLQDAERPRGLAGSRTAALEEVLVLAETPPGRRVHGPVHGGEMTT
jgi:hypothetical protein